MEFLFDVPDILYKYRDWTNPFNKRLLTHRELYFASVDKFNDPFDGTIPHRYDPAQMTDENIFIKYYQVTKDTYPNWTDEEIHKHCYEYQQRGYFKDETHLEHFEEHTKKNVNSSFGIVSLSKEQNNFLMWSHYSNSHKGFVVGFDKKLLYRDTQASFAHMQYQDNLPTLDLFEDTVTHFTKLIGTKSNIWSYENEYRLTKGNFARQNAILGTDTFAEIIFGCKMPQTDKFDLLNLIEQRYPDTRVFDSKLSKTRFETELIQIR
jgi:hypothetical protein